MILANSRSVRVLDAIKAGQAELGCLAGGGIKCSFHLHILNSTMGFLRRDPPKSGASEHRYLGIRCIQKIGRNHMGRCVQMGKDGLLYSVGGRKSVLS